MEGVERGRGKEREGKGKEREGERSLWTSASGYGKQWLDQRNQRPAAWGVLPLAQQPCGGPGGEGGAGALPRALRARGGGVELVEEVAGVRVAVSAVGFALLRERLQVRRADVLRDVLAVEAGAVEAADGAALRDCLLQDGGAEVVQLLRAGGARLSEGGSGGGTGRPGGGAW